MNDYRVPGSSCPTCGHVVNGALAARQEDAAPPRPGDVSICIECCAVSLFTEDLALELASMSSFTEEERREVERARGAIHEARARL